MIQDSLHMPTVSCVVEKSKYILRTDTPENKTVKAKNTINTGSTILSYPKTSQMESSKNLIHGRVHF